MREPHAVFVSALDGQPSVPGEVVSGIQAKNKQLSNFRRNRPADLRKHRQGGFSIGDNYEHNCKLLRYDLTSSPAGEGRVLHKKGSNQDCRTDCRADWCGYKIANLLTIRLSISVNSFVRCDVG